METLNSIFKLAAGIGLFLFAMYLIEEALKNISGRTFKLFLQRVTKNNIGAVAGGTIITGYSSEQFNGYIHALGICRCRGISV